MASGLTTRFECRPIRLKKALGLKNIWVALGAVPMSVIGVHLLLLLLAQSKCIQTVLLMLLYNAKINKYITVINASNSNALRNRAQSS